MEEELSLNSIMSEEEIAKLFDEDTESQEDSNKKQEENITETTSEETTEDESESVGNEDENKVTETPSEDEVKDSPNFYSSIAKALKEEGVLLELEDEKNIKTPEDFKLLIENQIKAGLDEKQKRIEEALNNNIPVDSVKNYENTLQYLNDITEENLTQEEQEGENLRKQLIYQDYINKGFTQERAVREVKKSFENGTDIEDAKEALAENKKYFTTQYDTLISEARKQRESEIKEREKTAELLKESILNDKELFGGLEIDKATRQRALENISKPVFKDPDTGQMFTAIQKYQKENKDEFLKNLGLVFTLTNGFKNFDSFIKTKVKKEVNKGLRHLEQTLNGSSKSFDGSINFVGNDDNESYLGADFSIDV